MHTGVVLHTNKYIAGLKQEEDVSLPLLLLCVLILVYIFPQVLLTATHLSLSLNLFGRGIDKTEKNICLVLSDLSNLLLFLFTLA